MAHEIDAVAYKSHRYRISEGKIDEEVRTLARRSSGLLTGCTAAAPEGTSVSRVLIDVDGEDIAVAGALCLSCS